MTTSLTQSFFARDTITVARELVGCVLCVTSGDGVEVSARIVEVEAYEGGNDPASHAGRGRTPRSEIMFGPAGYAYVYLIYGMHHCLNFVTEKEGIAGAVLIRALDPLTGRETMARRRGYEDPGVRDRNLCSGPGRLCQSLGIDIFWNGLPVAEGLDSPVSSAGGIIGIRLGEGPPGGPAATKRIGIRQAVDRLLRFTDPASPNLSG